MTFSECLTNYMNRASLSAAELARAAGLSPSTVSRYLKLDQTPGDAALRKLADAIAARIPEEADAILSYLSRTAAGIDYDYGTCIRNLHTLLVEFDISNNELARAISYDPSFISRILSGERRPASPTEFLKNSAAYLEKRFSDTPDEDAVRRLIGIPKGQVNIGGTDAGMNTSGGAEGTGRSLSADILAWLGQPVHNEPQRIAHFLETLDAFDLGEFFASTRFNDIKVPTAPFQFPTTRSYFGIEEMMQAELDFMRSAALSRSKEDIILYSDMPMEEMSKNPEFPKKWMVGLAVLLKKGIHLQNIHDVHRPLTEMILGLENWIPLYMTGQVTPYYLREATNDTFLHIIRSAGTAALTGEAIRGRHGDGKYTVYRSREDVAYCRKRARALLSRAHPLMQIYRAERCEAFRKKLAKLRAVRGDYRLISGAPPLFTMSEGLLASITGRCGLSAEEKAQIADWHREMTSLVSSPREDTAWQLELPHPESFDEDDRPVRLPFTELFPSRDLLYTKEEYLKHAADTEAFVKSHRDFSIRLCGQISFRNIGIEVCAGRYVLVSKSNMPAIHFLIYHPKMIEAFEQFSVSP